MSTWIARARVYDVHFRSGHARTSTHACDKQKESDCTAAVNSTNGFSSCQSAFLLPRERVERSLFRAFFRTSDLVYVSVRDTYLSRARTMKYRVTRLPTTMMCVVGVVLRMASTSPAEPLPSVLLDGIGNVANSATNFRELI